jgi:hypothetical protein
LNLVELKAKVDQPSRGYGSTPTDTLGEGAAKDPTKAGPLLGDLVDVPRDRLEGKLGSINRTKVKEKVLICHFFLPSCEASRPSQ